MKPGFVADIEKSLEISTVLLWNMMSRIKNLAEQDVPDDVAAELAAL
ncbi:MAG: hypothetical protein PHX50_08060 [Massilibacteroides sp.]|nr:hypothetical protein [Massilibacteroides sp.]